MRNPWKSGIACAMCASIALTLAPSETLAGVMSVPDKAIIAPPSPVDQVHYRRYHHRYWRHYHHHHWRHYHPWRHRHWRHRHYYRYGYYRRGYDPGAALFGAAALGLMAGAISAATAPRYYGWGYPAYGWGYRPWGWGW